MANRGGNTNYWPFLGVGAGIAAAIYLPRIIGAANVGKNLTTRFRGVTFGKVVGVFPSYRLQMNLLLNAVNPTGSSAKIDFIGLQIATPEGAPFADITRVNADYAIAPRSETAITVPFELSLTNTFVSVLFPAILDLIKSKGSTQSIGDRIKASLPSGLAVKGNIRVNSLRVGINEKVTVFKNTAPPAKT